MVQIKLEALRLAPRSTEIREWVDNEGRLHLAYIAWCDTE
jgi:hypothetical protein